jgi:hypothetical protein
MKLKAANRLTMLREVVAAEIPSSSVDRRRFASVVPREEGGFQVHRFEVQAAALATDRFLAPEDLLDRVLRVADNLDEVETILAELGIDSDSLDAPWHSDYPL